MRKEKRMPSSLSAEDMTKGSPIKLILSFAMPLFIGNIFQQVYSMVDTMIAGYNLGDDAIAAIGATSTLYGLLINLAVGMNSGYAIVVTQCFGAHDEKKLREAIAGMAILNAASAVILTVFSLAFLKPLLHFMKIPEAVFADAHSYIAVICAGIFSTVGYNLFSGIMRALGNSRTSLYFLILSSLINIGLDLFFITFLKMGIAGAALATVIAQTVSALLCGIWVFQNYRSLLPGRRDFSISREIRSELLSQGFSMMLMLCVVDLGSVIFQRANNGLGEMLISSYTAARRIIDIMMQPMSTIAMASSVFVGQNWGANKTGRIRSALKKALGLEIAWALFSCTLIFLFGAALVRFSIGTRDAQIVDSAVMSLRWHLAFFPALGCLLALRTSMQAMGQKTVPVISSCVELGMKLFSAAFLIPNLGFFGTCITEPTTWALMLALLAAALMRQNAASKFLCAPDVTGELKIKLSREIIFNQTKRRKPS